MPHARIFFAFPLVAGAIALAAPGCSSNDIATPQAGINWQITVGNNTSANCPVGGGDVWNIGGGNLSPVKDGDNQSGATVAVTCTVHSTGNGYDVSATVSLAGNGTFTLPQAHFDGTNNDQNNVTAEFIDAKGLIGTFKSDACVVSFHSPNMGIAPGRVWGMVECPAALDSQHQKTCDANAEFRFENCNQ